MPGAFFERLRDYYLKVASVLRGEAEAASIFPNSTDIGMSRERVYAEFLRLHAPAKCDVFLGGFLFGEDGSESSQLDVIVTTDTTPRFNFQNKGGQGKSFAPVEGTLAVASIKSTLDRKELESTLAGLASIAPTVSLDGRVAPALRIPNYDDWPYKIIYASDGISAESLLSHLNAFYLENPAIPFGRRPNVIHVSGKYVVFRATPGMCVLNNGANETNDMELGTFQYFTQDSDLQAIIWVLDRLQARATSSAHILYSYSDIANRLCAWPARSNVQPVHKGVGPTSGKPAA